MITNTIEMSQTVDRQIAIADLVFERMQEIQRQLFQNHLNSKISYKDLSEAEKIPLRVKAAEIQALKEFIFGENLELLLDQCVEKEEFCGAEGIKKAKSWIREKQLV